MSPRVILFFGSFFLSALTALSLYVLLPFLSTILPGAYGGLIVAGGSVAAFICFLYLPRLVARYGAQQLALIFALVEMLALFMLAVSPGVAASIALVILIVALQPIILYQFDLLLEAANTDTSATGRIRALFFTAWNAGSFVAPILIGTLLASSDAYNHVFMAAGAIAFPFIVLFAIRRLPSTTMAQVSPIRNSLVCILHDRDLAAVTFGHLVLWLFYAWTLYTPIYLHTVLGFSWSDLGWIFFFMLLPYVLIEYPAGWIADRFIGDKEMMFAGFLIAGTAFAALSLLTSASSLLLVLFLLVLSRMGTALIESMTEGHFFRRVSQQSINSVSIFRAAWPIAYVIGPIIGSIILFFGSYQLFFVLTGGFIALAGAGATFFIKDFR